MKILSRLMALVCVMALFAAPGFAQDIDDYAANLQATLTAAQALTDEFLAISDLEVMYNRMYAVVLSEEAALLNALSAEQVKAISDHANELYNNAEVLGEYDYENLEMIVDMLQIARNGSEVAVLATQGVFPENGQLTNGTYTMKADVKLTTNLTVASGVTATINLNGYVLTGNGEGSVITNSGTLTIKDSNPNKAHYGDLVQTEIRYRDNDVNGEAQYDYIQQPLWKYNINGTNNQIKGGIITGGVSRRGAGIDNNGGTLNFNGGTIAGCNANAGSGEGGGIANIAGGYLKIDGGNITYCISAGSGGGIYNGNKGSTTNSIVDFIKGSITYCVTKASGGGVNVTDGSTFNFGSKTGTAIPEISHNLVLDETQTGNGGGIHVGSATLVYNRGSIVANTSNNSGGGIYSYIGGSIIANGGTIEGNHSDGNGGGICQQYGDVKLSNMTISGNEANGGGGGVRVRIGDVELNNCTITNNKAKVSGGGVWVSAANNHSPHADDGSRGANATITNCVVSYNTANNGAGMNITVDNSTSACQVEIDGITLNNNVATVAGGGFFIEGANVTVTGNVTIKENRAKSGGALYLKDQRVNNAYAYDEETDDGSSYPNKFEHYTPITFSIDGGDIDNNTATEYGGAISISCNNAKNATDKARNSIAIGKAGGQNSSLSFEKNIAKLGGAIAIIDGSPILNCGTFKENSSTEAGGAMYVAGGTLTMHNGLLSDNGIKNGVVTTWNGGAVYVSGGTFTMNNGEFTGNKAMYDGGAAYVGGGSFAMADGVLTGNMASRNGGAVYVSGGKFTMTDGALNDNSANGDGGAAYVSGGSFAMADGVLTGNMASRNGGAVYVSGGKFTMTDGALNDNSANGDGGAVYVTELASSSVKPSFEMTNGEMLRNKAANGGAAYVNGGDFTMRSGKLNNNEAVASTGVSSYGGAAYANNGSIYIGLKGCKPDTIITPHNTIGHPEVQNNKATFGGAFAIHGGTVTLYCCNITQNAADNNGCGHNIFMYQDDVAGATGGELVHYYQGATIGTNDDHGIVSIGGVVNVTDYTGSSIRIRIKYDPDKESVTTEWEGEVPEGYSINLPFCPDDWVGANEAFVGWTPEDELGAVRKKSDYVHFGTAVELELVNGKYSQYIKRDPNGEYSITFTAVYAPKINNISYGYTLNGIDGEVKDTTWNPTTYLCQISNTEIEIPVIPMPGYTFLGWRLEAQKANANGEPVNSNWKSDVGSEYGCSTYMLADYDAYLKDDDPTKKLEDNESNEWSYDGKTLTIISESNFGDIRMVAIYEPAFSGLKIVVADETEEKTSKLDANESYYFKVEGTPSNVAVAPFTMYVSIIPNENGDGSTTIYNIPVGTYTITEINDWSWRYSSTVAVDENDNDFTDRLKMYSRGATANTSQTVNIPTIEQGKTVIFDVTRNKHKWLDDNANRSYPN